MLYLFWNHVKFRKMYNLPSAPAPVFWCLYLQVLFFEKQILSWFLPTYKYNYVGKGYATVFMIRDFFLPTMTHLECIQGRKESWLSPVILFTCKKEMHIITYFVFYEPVCLIIFVSRFLYSVRCIQRDLDIIIAQIYSTLY